jgi:hypothetical protein
MPSSASELAGKSPAALHEPQSVACRAVMPSCSVSLQLAATAARPAKGFGRDGLG